MRITRELRFRPRGALCRFDAKSLAILKTPGVTKSRCQVRNGVRWGTTSGSPVPWHCPRSRWSSQPSQWPSSPRRTPEDENLARLNPVPWGVFVPGGSATACDEDHENSAFGQGGERHVGFDAKSLGDLAPFECVILGVVAIAESSGGRRDHCHRFSRDQIVPTLSRVLHLEVTVGNGVLVGPS